MWLNQSYLYKAVIIPCIISEQTIKSLIDIDKIHEYTMWQNLIYSIALVSRPRPWPRQDGDRTMEVESWSPDL